MYVYIIICIHGDTYTYCLSLLLQFHFFYLFFLSQYVIHTCGRIFIWKIFIYLFFYGVVCRSWGTCAYVSLVGSLCVHFVVSFFHEVPLRYMLYVRVTEFCKQGLWDSVRYRTIGFVTGISVRNRIVLTGSFRRFFIVWFFSRNHMNLSNRTKQRRYLRNQSFPIDPMLEEEF